MRNIYRRFFPSLSIIAVALILARAPANSAELVYNLQILGPIGDRVAGPAKLVFVGINPFRYDWTAAVNAVAVEAPPLPFNVPSNNGPAAAPSKASNRLLETTSSSIDKIVPFRRKSKAPSRDTICNLPTNKVVVSCIAEAVKDIKDLNSEIDDDSAQLATAQEMFTGLQNATDSILKSVDTSTAEGRQNLQARVQAELLTKGTNPITLPNVADLISSIKPWPEARVIDLTTRFRVLESVLNASSGIPSEKVAAARRQLNSVSEMLQDASVSGDDRKLYDKELADMLLIKTTRLTNVTYNRFIFIHDERCGGLTAGGSQKTITLSLDAKHLMDVTVECDPRLVISAGVAFSRLEQRTFGSVPANTAGAPAPAPSSTPVPATIVEQNFSAVRPIAIAFANVRLFDGNPDSLLHKMYGSFGFTLNANSNYSNVDYAGGLSYSIGRTVFLTGGYHLGFEDFPAPGYAAGQFIANGSSPATLQKRRSAPFLGITFGR